MKKHQKLGQHFLISNSIAAAIVNAATIGKNDTVLEIGTGKGILIPYLCKNAKRVISIEIDKKLYELNKSQFSNPNLKLKHGNGFKTKDSFTIFISNLPYSKSRKAMEWSIQKKFSHAVVMVQKEFADKLMTNSDRRAITVLVNHSLEIKHLINVNKNNFLPRPKVDSVVLLLVRKKTSSDELIKIVNKMFSYRRKTLQNIFKQFGLKNESDKRLDDLSGAEIIKIAKQIARK